MKLDKEMAGQLYIPTAGMESFDVVNHREVLLTTGLYEVLRKTLFFRDKGQLHWSDDPSELTELVYLVQREDGVVKVVRAGLMGVNAYEILKEHLDPEIQAEVIECRISYALWVKCRDSETGVLAFYAFHHPDWEVRKGLAIGLLERENAHTNTCQHTETT
ncbi:hypothetical protein MAH1_20870 [Sessilibacter sp. MAH1]